MLTLLTLPAHVLSFGSDTSQTVSSQSQTLDSQPPEDTSWRYREYSSITVCCRSSCSIPSHQEDLIRTPTDVVSVYDLKGLKPEARPGDWTNLGDYPQQNQYFEFPTKYRTLFGLWAGFATRAVLDDLKRNRSQHHGEKDAKFKLAVVYNFDDMTGTRPSPPYSSKTGYAILQISHQPLRNATVGDISFSDTVYLQAPVPGIAVMRSSRHSLSSYYFHEIASWSYHYKRTYASAFPDGVQLVQRNERDFGDTLLWFQYGHFDEDGSFRKSTSSKLDWPLWGMIEKIDWTLSDRIANGLRNPLLRSVVALHQHPPNRSATEEEAPASLIGESDFESHSSDASSLEEDTSPNTTYLARLLRYIFSYG